MSSQSTEFAHEPLNLRERQITHRYGIGRSWFRELVAAGVLPQPQRWGSRMSIWNREALDAAFSDPALPIRIAEHNKQRRERRARKGGV